MSLVNSSFKTIEYSNSPINLYQSSSIVIQECSFINFISSSGILLRSSNFTFINSSFGS